MDALPEVPGTGRSVEPVREVSLVELTPQRPTSGVAPPSTAMVGDRTAPPGGVRERSGEVSVVSRCDQEDSCFDGLQDARTGKQLISPRPTRDEQETLAAPSWVQRVVRLVSVSDDFVSVYLGGATFSEGAAHANNALDCATFSRRTGRRLTLGEVVSRAQARALQEQARRLMEEYVGQNGLRVMAFSLRPRSFLYDAPARRIFLCATPSPTWGGGSLLLIHPGGDSSR